MNGTIWNNIKAFRHSKVLIHNKVQNSNDSCLTVTIIINRKSLNKKMPKMMENLQNIKFLTLKRYHC